MTVKMRKRDDLIDTKTLETRFSYQILSPGSSKWAWPVENNEMCVYDTEVERDGAMDATRIRLAEHYEKEVELC